MSDRYKQLIFPDDVVRCRPESQPQSETPVKVAASVSSDKFEIGDRVNCKVIINSYAAVKRKGVITEIIGNDYYWLKIDDGDLHISHARHLRKVREQNKKTREKVREQNKKLPSNSYIEIKSIKGKFYKYARWREDGVLRSKYLGKCSLTESRI